MRRKKFLFIMMVLIGVSVISNVAHAEPYNGLFSVSENTVSGNDVKEVTANASAKAVSPESEETSEILTRDSAVEIGNFVLCDFKKEEQYGISTDSYGGVSHIKKHKGIIARIDGSDLNITTYSEYPITTGLSYGIAIKEVNGNGTYIEEGVVDWNECMIVNLGELKYNQWYSFSVDGASFPLYNNGTGWYMGTILENERYKKCINEKKVFDEKVANINPEDCKTNYPYVLDNEASFAEWEVLSEELCKDKETDEEKVLAIYDWVCTNMFYDWYYYNHKELYGSSKGAISLYPNNCNSLWERKGGVCHQLAKAFEVMVRTQGIPAIMPSGSDHTWNAVYLDGEWYQIDCTHGCKNSAYDEAGTVTYRSMCYQDYATGLRFWSNHTCESKSDWENAGIIRDYLEGDAWHISNGCRGWKGYKLAYDPTTGNTVGYCSWCGVTRIESYGTPQVPSVTPQTVQRTKPVITVKKSAQTYKAKSLKRKSKTFSIGVKTNGGKVTYAVTKTPKGAKRYIKVSRNGKVTVKKGAKKGTYKITVKVAATSLTTAGKKVITIKVK